MGSYLILATVNLVLGGLAFLLGMLILRENPRQRLNRSIYTSSLTRLKPHCNQGTLKK